MKYATGADFILMKYATNADFILMKYARRDGRSRPVLFYLIIISPPHWEKASKVMVGNSFTSSSWTQ